MAPDPTCPHLALTSHLKDRQSYEAGLTCRGRWCVMMASIRPACNPNERVAVRFVIDWSAFPLTHPPPPYAEHDRDPTSKPRQKHAQELTRLVFEKRFELRPATLIIAPTSFENLPFDDNIESLPELGTTVEGLNTIFPPMGDPSALASPDNRGSDSFQKRQCLLRDQDQNRRPPPLALDGDTLGPGGYAPSGQATVQVEQRLGALHQSQASAYSGAWPGAAGIPDPYQHAGAAAPAAASSVAAQSLHATPQHLLMFDLRQQQQLEHVQLPLQQLQQREQQQRQQQLQLQQHSERANRDESALGQPSTVPSAEKKRKRRSEPNVAVKGGGDRPPKIEEPTDEEDGSVSSTSSVHPHSDSALVPSMSRDSFGSQPSSPALVAKMLPDWQFLQQSRSHGAQLSQRPQLYNLQQAPAYTPLYQGQLQQQLQQQQWQFHQQHLQHQQVLFPQQDIEQHRLKLLQQHSDQPRIDGQ
eukprot:TRINITY_DN1867_c0_g1_i2.p1 TRINITY_DN1867_c0_g1~~TRINITY_DN1867_c0_g1_i2.p1  ORF type:complete len:471 (-),score=47.68 TRINITY_DN1867_c0_g1_i2:38-1450(-)